MKTVICTAAILLSLASISEAKTLTCQSYHVVEGWNAVATHDYVVLRGEIQSNDTLVNTQITGAFVTSSATSVADTQYASKNPRYTQYTRFSSLEDAWCWYSPFLLKEMANTTVSAFTGFINRTCEGGSSANIAMKCVIK
jgi:hypothetical protein